MALALATLSSVATTRRPAAAAPLSRFEIFTALDSADRVLVMHLRLTGSASADSSRGGSARRAMEPIARANADHAWASRLEAALANAGPFDSLANCVSSCWPCDGLDQVVATVTVSRQGVRHSLLMRFRERCIDVYDPSWRPTACIAMAGAAPALFDLVKAALPADSALRARELPVAAWSESTRTAHRVAKDETYVEQLPVVEHRVPPQYPRQARADGIEGTVQIEALIDTDGRVVDMEVRQSIPALDQAALAAVKKWTFRPAMADGKPVRVWVAIPVKFTLR